MLASMPSPPMSGIVVGELAEVLTVSGLDGVALAAGEVSGGLVGQSLALRRMRRSDRPVAAGERGHRARSAIDTPGRQVRARLSGPLG
jgi:hypothetical protein